MEVGLKPPKQNKLGKKFLQNFISSRDGPGKNTETRQRTLEHMPRLYVTRVQERTQDKGL